MAKRSLVRPGGRGGVGDEPFKGKTMAKVNVCGIQ